MVVGPRLSRRKRRRSALTGSCLIFVLFVLFSYSHRPVSSSSEPTVLNPDEQSLQSNALIKEQAQFWRSIFHLILNNDPECSRKLEVVISTKLDVAYQSNHARTRPSLMSITKSDVGRLKSAHTKFVGDVEKSALKLVYNTGSRGIITTVSDSQIPVLLISLRMLRETGSSLPVEVFFWSSSPYTSHLCSNILPDLNSKCIFLHSIFTEASTGVGLETYQHKIFAILFSSFEDVLFLDADAWPATNPDSLFTTPPFTETGLILWPDFWYASESPYFFVIAGIYKPPALADRAATEAGQLMYSKSKHQLSIMLAAYYNYFGPDYYYPLQSQGAPGQGDKETFGLAALALNESFYAVPKPVTALGRQDSSGDFLGSAMIQYDPRTGIDLVGAESTSDSVPHGHDHFPNRLATAARHDEPEYPYLAAKKDHNQLDRQKSHTPPSIIEAAHSFASDGETDESDSDEETPITKSRPLFIHANYPKFDPRTIFNEEINGAHTPTRDTNGTTVRCWDMTPSTAKKRFGYDIEKRLWKVIQHVACRDLMPSSRLHEANAKGNENINELGRNVGEDAGTGRKGQKELEVCVKVQKYTTLIFGGFQFAPETESDHIP